MKQKEEKHYFKQQLQFRIKQINNNNNKIQNYTIQIYLLFVILRKYLNTFQLIIYF